MAKSKMGKRGPKSRKGDPNWKPRSISIKSDKKVAPRNASKLPTTKAEQDKLGDELVLWAEKHQGAYTLNGFALSKNYSPYKLNKLAEKNKYFADCLELARYFLLHGMQERILASEKISQFAYQWMRDHHRWWDKDYAKHWRDMIEARKSKEDKVGNERVVYKEVVIPDFGTSGVVPDKKEDDESRREDPSK